MSQEQLHPHFNQDFVCNSCQRKFYQTTAYSPTKEPVFLTETYCAECIEEEPEFCSFNEIDDKTKKAVACTNEVFDKKKQLCRSHNRQVRKRFNEFLKDESTAGSGAWEMVWEQSGDWKYFWNLGKEREKTTKKNSTKINQDWNKIKKKSLGEVPQEPSQNLQAPELAPSDKRISGRTKQLNLKVREETYWKLKEFALKEKRLMTEVLEKALAFYEKRNKKQ